MEKVIPPLIALDVETTGLKPDEGDRIVEIALIKFDEKGKIIDKFISLINPEREIPLEVTKFINRIDKNMVEKAPKFKEVAKEIKNFIEGGIVVIHNADFDISFLKKEFQLCEEELPEFGVIDTLYIARKYFNFPSNSLSSLAKNFKIEKESHRAENDAITAYEIFNHFVKKIDVEIDELICPFGEI